MKEAYSVHAAPEPKVLLLAYSFAMNDPPQRQAVLSLAARGWQTAVLQLSSEGTFPEGPPEGVRAKEAALPPSLGGLPRSARSLVGFVSYSLHVRRMLKSLQPDLIVTNMLHSFAAAHLMRKAAASSRVVSFIPDIPSPADAGRLDAIVQKYAWRNLSRASLIWASDVHKASLARQFGKLSVLPLVCHNCPTLEYLPNLNWPRDRWLRNELRRQGASVDDGKGCVLLRAGAVGECCGIEETLMAIKDLPRDFVFVMLGRPLRKYVDALNFLIRDLGLAERAILWERPSDEIWKKALLGADIGHLVQGPYSSQRMTRAHALNSSLSNNKLFQYLAAGLPIVAHADPRLSDLYESVRTFRTVRLQHLVEDLRRELTELYLNPDLRRDLGDAGRRAHLRVYNWEAQFGPVLDAISGLFAGTGVRPTDDLRN